MEWAGEAFSPADEWVLIFTAKDSANDADADSVFQKTSGSGIEVAAEIATVSLVPYDSLELTEGPRVFDIQAQRISDGKVRTVAVGELYFMRDITRETSTSVPVVTTETPLPFATETTESILEKLEGAEEDANKIGAEYLPDALTWASGDPNIPENLTVTGITEPLDSDPVLLERVADANGYARWEVDDWVVTWGSGDWSVSKNLGVEFLSYSASLVESPVGLTFDAPEYGAGIPVITGDNPIGSFIGQRLQVIDTGIWYSWDGSQWVADLSTLGNSASLDVGTTAGTVAAGDHTHTNAQVNTAIATDPAATRAALQISTIFFDVDKPVTAGAMTNISGMTATLEANAEYEISGFVGITTTGGSPTNRIQLRLAYSGTLAANPGMQFAFQTNGFVFPMVKGAWATTTFADVNNVDRAIPVIAYIRTSTSGSLTVQGHRISGGTLDPYIEAGSRLILRRVN
jgi:hypothetical protein